MGNRSHNQRQAVQQHHTERQIAAGLLGMMADVRTFKASRRTLLPSWCRTHKRPHWRTRQLCLTNRERRVIRRLIDQADSVRRHPAGKGRADG